MSSGRAWRAWLGRLWPVRIEGGGREGEREEETGCECPMCKLGESETDDR